MSTTQLLSQESLPPATCAADNPLWFGPSRKAAKQRHPWTITWALGCPRQRRTGGNRPEEDSGPCHQQLQPLILLPQIVYVSCWWLRPWHHLASAPCPLLPSDQQDVAEACGSRSYTDCRSV